jgi:DNA modification methylase
MVRAVEDERPVTIRVIEGDATRMDGVDAASVHLIVTSPPYPMIPQWDETFHRQGADDFDGMHDLLARVWRRSREVLVPGGLLAINIGDALRSTAGAFQLWPNHVEVAARCRSLGLVPLPYLLWKKPTNRPNAFLGSGFLPPNAYVTLDCEFVLLFRNGALRRFPAHDRSRSESRFTKPERDRWFSQVWTDVRGARQAGPGARTGAFPPELPERLIRMFSCVGETVLDPFAGTGTTLWAAEKLGRNSIGIELDAARCAELRESARVTKAAGAGGSPAAGAPRQRRAGGSGAPGRPGGPGGGGGSAGRSVPASGRVRGRGYVVRGTAVPARSRRPEG